MRLRPVEKVLLDTLEDLVEKEAFDQCSGRGHPALLILEQARAHGFPSTESYFWAEMVFLGLLCIAGVVLLASLSPSELDVLISVLVGSGLLGLGAIRARSEKGESVSSDVWRKILFRRKREHDLEDYYDHPIGRYLSTK